MFSHHDLLESECSIPPQQEGPIDESKNITAPRLKKVQS